MILLEGVAKEFKVKYVTDVEMTKNDRIMRMQYNEQEIQFELE
jgi:hypothetical protein